MKNLVVTEGRQKFKYVVHFSNMMYQSHLHNLDTFMSTYLSLVQTFLYYLSQYLPDKLEIEKNIVPGHNSSNAVLFF